MMVLWLQGHSSSLDNRPNLKLLPLSITSVQFTVISNISIDFRRDSLLILPFALSLKSNLYRRKNHSLDWYLSL